MKPNAANKLPRHAPCRTIFLPPVRRPSGPCGRRRRFILFIVQSRLRSSCVAIRSDESCSTDGVSPDLCVSGIITRNDHDVPWESRLLFSLAVSLDGKVVVFILRFRRTIYWVKRVFMVTDYKRINLLKLEMQPLR